MKTTLSSIWESNSKQKSFHIISESNENSEVDGVNILARVSGPAFFPDTTSRNKIHYPKEAWVNAISADEFQERLRKRLVLGTIGHDPDITDNEVRSGLFSHVVTKVWIDEETDIGMAEFLVLNTESGRILNTLLRSGVMISVSTKAYGDTLKDPSLPGTEIVDPDNFILDRIDFVLDPGYKEAVPVLKESKNIEDNTIMTDLTKLEESLKKLLQENKGDINMSEYKSLQESITSLKVNEAKLSTELDQYKSIGTPSAIQETYNALAEYRAIGTAKDIKESLDEGEETVEQLTAKIEELQQKLADLQTNEDHTDYSDIGTPEEINQAFDLAEKLKEKTDAYNELGTPEEIKELLNSAENMSKELEQYRELGTPDEIKETLGKMNEIAEENEKQELLAKAQEVGVDPSVVDTLKGKGLSVEDILDVLDSMSTVSGDPDVAIEENGDTGEEDEQPESQPEDNQEDGGEGDDEEEEGKTFTEALNSMSLRTLSRFKRFQESKKTKTDSKKVNESKAVGNQLLSKLIK